MATSNLSPRQFQGIFDVILAKASVNIADLAAGADAHLNVTVTGAKLGDFVLWAPGVDVTDVIFSVVVTADDTVTVSAVNETGDHIDLDASTWNFALLRPKGPFDSL